ncbi:MAG: hypothetical protein IJJ33_14780 [Victivallales bacterium]|nr:hypothetical protein [Victivallales bacterium]
MNIDIQFKEHLKAIKPLHGVNRSPIRLTAEKIVEFEEAGIPFVRTHDCGGAYGRGVFVDIPNLFRDFDADENAPESYDFAFTDRYLSCIVNAGAKVFFRLGVTIENNWRIRAYRIAPPRDFAKWARVCEHVVRHYNEGWADGFQWGVQYWEIWNEPENPPMWQGTREQFLEFYAEAATHLKRCFPAIKVGGYAGCGFYSFNREGTNDFYKGFLTWFDEFLAYNRSHAVPMDFYSFHLYTNDPKEIILHANYARGKLDAAGFTKAELIFNEWNYAVTNKETFGSDFDAMKELPGALFIAESFCRMQDSPIDKAMYYDAEPSSGYGGLFYFPSQRTTPTFQSFVAFNQLYQLGQQAKVTADLPDQVVILAATDGATGKVLLVNRGIDDLRIPFSCDVTLENATAKTLKDGKLAPIAEPGAAHLLQNGRLSLTRQTLLLLDIPFNGQAQAAPAPLASAGRQAPNNANGIDG